jgi:type VII secretion system ESX-1 substrate
MTALGETNDPTALIPGDPASIYQTEAELRRYGDLLAEAGKGLQRIDTAGGWSGPAADAFRGVFDGQPRKWLQAGTAFHAAADALNSYAESLTWAQGQAGTAIGQWNGGDHQAANGTLSRAEGQLTAAGSTAATAIGRARDLAPPKPGLWSRIGHDIGTALSDAGHFAEDVGTTVLSATASVGNAMLHDPGSVGEMLAGTAVMALGAGGEVGGFALDITGIGAALGVPVGVVSTAVMAGGAGLAVTGMHTVASDAAGPDQVNMSSSSGGGGGGGGETGPGDGASNRIRPAQEGDTNYVVDNPADLSHTITDIDRVEDGTLWEEKTATGQDPRMNVPQWVQRNVTGKLNSYLEARQYMPGYENAPLGLDFTQSGATPEFQQAVQDAVQQWRAANPGVPVTVRWAP